MRRLAPALVGLLCTVPLEAQRLVEVLVAPSDGTILGEISDVDILPDGRVLALDIQADAVFVFDDGGRLERILGGPGEGPGEIALSTEVEVGPGGEVMVADPQNRRLTLWSGDGDLLNTASFDALFDPSPGWAHDLVWEASGLVLKTSQFRIDAPIEIRSVPPDLTGRGALILSIETEGDAPTCVFCAIGLDPKGRPVAVRGDTLYAIVSFDTQGRGAQEWMRSNLPAARRSEAEIARLQAGMRRVAGAEGAGGDAPAFSDFKTRFGPHSLAFDDLGRLWTAPRTTEDAMGSFDVFSVDGEYSATIAVDVPIGSFRIRRDYLVVASETDIGEPVVRLYRIEF